MNLGARAAFAAVKVHGRVGIPVVLPPEIAALDATRDAVASTAAEVVDADYGVVRRAVVGGIGHEAVAATAGFESTMRDFDGGDVGQNVGLVELTMLDTLHWRPTSGVVEGEILGELLRSLGKAVGAAVG